MQHVNLKEKYVREVAPKLKELLKRSNVLAVPRIEKVVVNVGLGRLRNQAQFEDKALPEVISAVSLITGQRPAIRPAKKSIAGFKIREGDAVGLAAVLRGKRMYDFLDKVINVSFPRTRDFRGISEKNVDRSGNLTFGFKEHTVFPEVDIDSVKVNFGLEATVVLKGAKNREEAIKLYGLLGFPLKTGAKS